ncbi:MAG: succinate dehydrogenase [Rhodospirillaceae bacterium TMED8]|nr:succinate dehydrogenase [Magnetovibrio sp.]OUT48998.1 MAG: succinate dehydrogenase [Rhodospirillaceae bacterium TMED8]|tara:strand:- start:9 stop:350 length:342 start_codon:yes stop_codon:yes gene_type:complete
MRGSHRSHANYWAFGLHRISGILLALFLPIHFHVLYLAVHNDSVFDEFVYWAESPLVKVAETVLVVLLALHLTGGVRLLAIEFFPWRDWQKTIVAVTTGLSLATGLIFLLNVI